MSSKRILALNEIIKNFQISLKDAGDRICGEEWTQISRRFPYGSIGYIKQGTIRICVSGQERIVDQGGLYYIPAMEEYSHRVESRTAEVYWTHFDLGQADKPVASQIRFPVSVRAGDPELIEELYRQIFSQMWSGTLGAPLKLVAAMQYLFAQYLTLCQEEVSLNGKSETEAAMEKIPEFIRENLDRNLTVELLAARVGLTPGYFIHEFERMFQKTPIQYVHSQREAAARAFLENSRMSIKEISLTLGFSNQNHFSAFFKKRSGYAPSEYRKLKSKLEVLTE